LNNRAGGRLNNQTIRRASSAKFLCLFRPAAGF